MPAKEMTSGEGQKSSVIMATLGSTDEALKLCLKGADSRGVGTDYNGVQGAGKQGPRARSDG